MFDGMPLVSAIFFAGEILKIKNLCCDAKHMCRTLVMKNMFIFFNLNKNLTYIYIYIYIIILLLILL